MTASLWFDDPLILRRLEKIIVRRWETFSLKCFINVGEDLKQLYQLVCLHESRTLAHLRREGVDGIVIKNLSRLTEEKLQIESWGKIRKRKREETEPQNALQVKKVNLRMMRRHASGWERKRVESDIMELKIECIQRRG